MSFLKLYVLEISEYHNNGPRTDNSDYWLLVKFNNWYIRNDWNINCSMCPMVVFWFVRNRCDFRTLTLAVELLVVGSTRCVWNWSQGRPLVRLILQVSFLLLFILSLTALHEAVLFMRVFISNNLSKGFLFSLITSSSGFVFEGW